MADVYTCNPYKNRKMDLSNMDALIRLNCPSSVDEINPQTIRTYNNFSLKYAEQKLA